MWVQLLCTCSAENASQLYGDMMHMQAYEQTREDKTKPYSLRDIIDAAQQIQDDCRDRPLKPVLSSGKPARPVFILSYQTYPEGKARMYDRLHS
jgi:hypothetical protein